MERKVPVGRVDLAKYIVVSVWFGCNNACNICMLSDIRGTLPPIGFDRYRKIIRDVVREERFENLILSGAEVTTFDDLDRYVRFATSFDWFRKIQVQTNGRRLADRRYLDNLVACGVNEFFVSVHGLEEVHDAITGVAGSFRETLAGLRNLGAYRGVNVITNTVLNQINVRELRPLMNFLAGLRTSEIHLWNLFPMGETDRQDLLVGLPEFLRILPEILEEVGPSGKPVVLKSFPECLPAGPPAVFDDWFPVTVLPNRFWQEFGRSGFGSCVHREKCGARECWGLSNAYLRKFGDERELLSPFGGRSADRSRGAD
ncbi:MAG: radical SAM protein [Syntrophaceae bacterium]|nr:radical SAM protein [Syntrophaceae bacterium]